MIAARNPDTDRPYLADLGLAVEEIGTLAQLLTRLVALDRQSDPLTVLERAVVLRMAAERDSVRFAARLCPAPTSCTACDGTGGWACACGISGTCTSCQ